MSGIGSIWGIAKIAATKIPWGKVMDNVPAVVELVKDRLRAHASAPGGDLDERIRSLQDENLKLEKALLQTSDHLQEAIKTLKVVSARQKTLTMTTVLALLIAVSSLIVSLAR